MAVIGVCSVLRGLIAPSRFMLLCTVGVIMAGFIGRLLLLNLHSTSVLNSHTVNTDFVSPNRIELNTADNGV